MNTKNKYEALEVGTRVYYTGDMANVDGVGTITAVHGPDRFYARWYTIKLDDGRDNLGIMPSNFGHPSTNRGERFQVLAERVAFREEQIAQLRAAVAK